MSEIDLTFTRKKNNKKLLLRRLRGTLCIDKGAWTWTIPSFAKFKGHSIANGQLQKIVIRNGFSS